MNKQTISSKSESLKKLHIRKSKHPGDGQYETIHTKQKWVS